MTFEFALRFQMPGSGRVFYARLYADKFIMQSPKYDDIVAMADKIVMLTGNRGWVKHPENLSGTPTPGEYLDFFMYGDLYNEEELRNVLDNAWILCNSK